MNKPLDLPDVTLSDVRRLVHAKPSEMHLCITHKNTGMQTYISHARLNAWLLRQLRQELVSNKERP